jgi:hypothetical protein
VGDRRPNLRRGGSRPARTANNSTDYSHGSRNLFHRSENLRKSVFAVLSPKKSAHSASALSLSSDGMSGAMKGENEIVE